MSKKKELGKGIRALITDISAQGSYEVATDDKGINTSFLVPTKSIEKNPYQPRMEFAREQMLELADSIRKFGIIQPLTLRRLNDNSFQLISGERRLRAAKLAGLEKVPAYLREANDQEMVEMALIENIQRTDLNAIEIAISYQRLMDEFSLTQEALSERVGKDRSTISNYVRLLKLPPIIQTSLKHNEISMGHAKVLAGIEDPILQIDLYKKIKENSISVRATEKLVEASETKKIHNILAPSSRDPYLLKAEDDISAVLGTKVQIKRNSMGKGQMIIRFNSDKQLNQIMDSLLDN